MAARRVSLLDFPRLTRFYGVSPRELARTPHNILAVYAEQLPELQAEEALFAFTASDMPHLKPADRRSVYRSFERHVPKPEPVKVDVRSEEGAALVTQKFGIKIDIPQTGAES